MTKWVFRGLAGVLALSLIMLLTHSLRLWGDKQAYQQALAAVGRATPAPTPQDDREAGSQSKPTAAPTAAAPPATAPPAAETPAASTPQPTPTPEPIPDEAAGLLEIDLNALQAVNSDVIGWVEIPGTLVSYPLMQGEDNHHYLDYDWRGDPSVSGSVFLESTNQPDLSNYSLIIYAHRMLDDSMFGSLRFYEEEAYWQEHPSVYLLTPDGLRQYDIFAAHEAPITSLVYRLDLEKSHLEQDFLDFCLDSSIIDTGIVPQPEEQVLTLSTCTVNGYDARWVVQAVLRSSWERG